MKKQNKKVRTEAQKGSSVSSLPGARTSKTNFIATFMHNIKSQMDLRQTMKLYQTFDNEAFDLTPKLISSDSYTPQFEELHNMIKKYFEFDMGSMISFSASTRSTFRMGGFRVSMDDILKGVGSSLIQITDSKKTIQQGDTDSIISKRKILRTSPFIRVTLRLSNTEVLFVQRSCTALRDTPEGDAVLEDNKIYEYLTQGKGKVRRRSEADAQTLNILCKSREVNTETHQVAESGGYVSFYEMFDTYQKLDSPTKHVKGRDASDLPAAMTKRPVSEQCNAILQLPKFRLSSMITRRALSGNEYEEAQRRYRNMDMPSRLDKNLKYLYTLRLLFRFESQMFYAERKSVADFSFCTQNGDILAVAYGIYNFTAMQVPKGGYVCIWNIKNPHTPERYYIYQVAVVSIAFSPFIPTLIAIGLYDGTVEVRDISKTEEHPIAVSQRSTSPGYEPIMALCWIKQTETSDPNEIQPFLSLSQDGSVTKYRIINSPHLLGFKQMVLDRVEGSPEGLQVKKLTDVDDVPQANRHPQGLNITLHPLHSDLYYILTDEGCVYKCSTNYQHQYLEVCKTHDGCVQSMDFSPWSPKLFLTCGNDWCIRIWIEGVFKPLITLKNLMPVHCAQWSRTHSTVIMSLTRKAFDIWDIRRNILQPVSTTSLDTSHYTIFKFAQCGRSVAIGNERGNVLICALDNFPFPSHFQYDELEKAIYKAVALNVEIKIELKSVGFFGYPNKKFNVVP